MTHQTKKMSEMMKEMSDRLLRHPDAAHSSEAAHVALMFANIAWNKSVGLGHAIEGYRSGALSQNQVQRMLGLTSRWEVDALLKRAGVYLEYTEEDLEQEIERSRELSDR